MEVTPDHWWGSRDRSWGIRPVGEPEPPGSLAGKPGAGFRWLYAPIRMEDHALVLICQERDDGSRVLEEAVRLWPDGRVDHLGRPEHDLRSEEHTSELQSLMRISYAVFCLTKKNIPYTP